MCQTVKPESGPQYKLSNKIIYTVDHFQADHVARMVERWRNVLVGYLEVKRPLWRLRLRWEDRMVLKEIVWFGGGCGLD